MTAFHRRIFIFLDEWLGILLLYILRHDHDPAFWIVLPIWVVMVYLLSYPPHWYASLQESKTSSRE